jgi:hypothetical protein
MCRVPPRCRRSAPSRPIEAIDVRPLEGPAVSASSVVNSHRNTRGPWCQRRPRVRQICSIGSADRSRGTKERPPGMRKRAPECASTCSCRPPCGRWNSAVYCCSFIKLRSITDFLNRRDRMPMPDQTTCSAATLTLRYRRRGDRVNLSHCVNWRWRTAAKGHEGPPTFPAAGAGVVPIGSESSCSGQDRSRVYRLCQGQSGQAQHGVGR